uniref:Uncharacterized protein n=1 Tax=Rhizophora mucronata TaxID=61149 RepID=A0A2P2N2P3_RHIMU
MGLSYLRKTINWLYIPFIAFILKIDMPTSLNIQYACSPRIPSY